MSVSLSLSLSLPLSLSLSFALSLSLSILSMSLPPSLAYEVCVSRRLEPLEFCLHLRIGIPTGVEFDLLFVFFRDYVLQLCQEGSLIARLGLLMLQIEALKLRQYENNSFSQATLSKLQSFRSALISCLCPSQCFFTHSGASSSLRFFFGAMKRPSLARAASKSLSFAIIINT